MDEPLELFWEDLDAGEVHIRDKWQFTLKSEFFPQSGNKPSKYVQEFYLFIPNSFQINESTYSKNEFYIDETNFIRYKTPEFTFDQLLDGNETRSPLTRILTLCEQDDTPMHRIQLSDELKLLANVVRSALRRDAKLLLFSLGADRNVKPSPDFESRTLQLCDHLKTLRRVYAQAKETYLKNWKDPLFYRQMVYADEFISNSISYYLTGLLENLRLTGNKEFDTVDNALSELLLGEKRLSDNFVGTGTIKPAGNDTSEGEAVLYRYGLLNKFVLDALSLTTNRFSLDQRYQHWIGGISAGAAMLVYFSLFLWLGNVFVINSSPFLMLMIIAYVLKDRIKEWLRSYSYLQASRWFPDYITLIKRYAEKRNMGVLKESFSFIKPPQLPEEIKVMRDVEFHTILEAVPRPESIIYYKRIVEMNAPPVAGARRLGINVIFRYNIHRFLNKAADPSEMHLTIDPATKKLISVRLPKVYHLNLIIRTTTIESDKPTHVQLKKLRLIVDKNGIKRIEQL